MESNKKATDPKPGDALRFDNGGRIQVAWVKDGWVGFATWLPADDEPWLRRMTAEDFAASIAMTPAKIVEYAHVE